MLLQTTNEKWYYGLPNSTTVDELEWRPRSFADCKSFQMGLFGLYASSSKGFNWQRASSELSVTAESPVSCCFCDDGGRVRVVNRFSRNRRETSRPDSHLPQQLQVRTLTMTDEAAQNVSAYIPPCALLARQCETEYDESNVDKCGSYRIWHHYRWPLVIWKVTFWSLKHFFLTHLGKYSVCNLSTMFIHESESGLLPDRFWYPHMPIGKVWIYHLLFVCGFVLCVCFVCVCVGTVPDFSADDKASGGKFCTAVHRRPRKGVTNFCEVCFPRKAEKQSRTNRPARLWTLEKFKIAAECLCIP